jgi:hypothetical protein
MLYAFCPAGYTMLSGIVIQALDNPVLLISHVHPAAAENYKKNGQNCQNHHSSSSGNSFPP